MVFSASTVQEFISKIVREIYGSSSYKDGIFIVPVRWDNHDTFFCIGRKTAIGTRLLMSNAEYIYSDNYIAGTYENIYAYSRNAL